MSQYADTSFLVSCYVEDAHTPQAKVCLSTVSAPLLFTALHVLEVRNAFKLGVFRRLFTAAEAAAAWRDVEKDLHSGRLVKVAVNWTAVFRAAAEFSDVHSMTTGTRSLDILHVATAKAARAQRFFSFDSRQRALATALGMNVAP